MSKIKIIEKSRIENLKDFVIKDLNEIVGGANASKYTCAETETLKCSPFTGKCLSVKINDDIYVCDASGGTNLKKGDCVISSLPLLLPISIVNNLDNYPIKLAYYEFNCY
jgi:hypothetical protein